MDDDQAFYFIIAVMLIVIEASLVAAPDTKEFPDLQSACARMDIWDLSEVAKASGGAVDTCIKSQGRPDCSCSRCALSGKK